MAALRILRPTHRPHHLRMRLLIVTPDSWCIADRHAASLAAYVAGCRCASARAASAAYERSRYHQRQAGHRRLVDATGTRRRLQALCASGWPGPMLADRLFVTRGMLDHWRKQRLVSHVNAAKVAALYDEIGLDDGPSRISRAVGRRNGWHLPIEWGPDIDDPHARPLRLDRLGSPHWPLEEIEYLVDASETLESIASRAGIEPAALKRRLQRAQRDDLLRRLAARSLTAYASEVGYAEQERRRSA